MVSAATRTRKQRLVCCWCALRKLACRTSGGMKVSSKKLVLARCLLHPLFHLLLVLLLKLAMWFSGRHTHTRQAMCVNGAHTSSLTFLLLALPSSLLIAHFGPVTCALQWRHTHILLSFCRQQQPVAAGSSDTRQASLMRERERAKNGNSTSYRINMIYSFCAPRAFVAN